MAQILEEIKLCNHCGQNLAIANPSGYCNHVYYPENCKVCQSMGQGLEVRDNEGKFTIGFDIAGDDFSLVIVYQSYKTKQYYVCEDIYIDLNKYRRGVDEGTLDFFKGKEVNFMEQNPPATASNEREDKVREHLDAALKLMREEAQSVNGLRSRAAKIGVTQLELASMACIRSFFAEEEYSPLKKLQPAS